jgi:lactate dehydrogenase-like 2-hydroxyacid dehydrogenase
VPLSPCCALHAAAAAAVAQHQVLVTPHSAFLTHEALANIGATTVQNVTEFLSGKPLTNELKIKPTSI